MFLGSPLFSDKFCFVSSYVKDHYLDVLSKTPALTHLSLAKCRLLTDAAFRKISLAGRLTDLDIRHTMISTAAFTDVVQNCPNLVRVNISGCNEVHTEFFLLGFMTLNSEKTAHWRNCASYQSMRQAEFFVCQQVRQARARRSLSRCEPF